MAYSKNKSNGEKNAGMFSNEVSYTDSTTRRAAVAPSAAFCLLARRKAPMLSLSYGLVQRRTWEWLVAAPGSWEGFCTSESLHGVLQLGFLQTASFICY